MAALTEKQRRFVAAWIKTANASEAARIAGYSVKTARTQGEQLMRKPEIRAELIKEMKGFIDSQVAEAREVLEFLTACMRGEVTEDVPMVIGTGNGKSAAQIVKKQISARERIRAAELLAKRYNLIEPEEKMGDTVYIVDDFSQIPPEE